MWLRIGNCQTAIPPDSILNLEGTHIYYGRKTDRFEVANYETASKAQYVFVKIIEKRKMPDFDGIIDIDEIEKDYVKIHDVKKEVICH